MVIVIEREEVARHIAQHQGLQPAQVEQAVLQRLLDRAQEGLRRVGPLELQQPVQGARAATVQV